MKGAGRMRKALACLAIGSLLGGLVGDSAEAAMRGSSLRALRAGKAKRPSRPMRRYVEGEVLVKFRSGMQSNGLMSGVMANHGVAGMKAFSLGRARAARGRVGDGMSVEQKIEELRQDPDVEDAQPNYVYHALAAPTDPSYAQQWGFRNTGQTIPSAEYATGNPGTAGKDMSLEAAWDKITDCSSAPVAIIDTGVNYNHEDLKANLWDGGSSYPLHGYNFVEDNRETMDFNGHGTHVAGTIGAAANGMGGVGVCWKANLMILRALDATGSGSTADIVQAIQFAIAHGARVLNMSLGQGSDDNALKAAIQSASDAGIVIVVAAGNDGANNDSTPTYPCNYSVPNLVCVAALDQKFALASFSNYGSASVDVGAPGTNVVSSYAGVESTFADSFATGGALNWTASGTTGTNGWAYGQRSLSDGTNSFTVGMLMNPSTWDGSTKKYATNIDARVYKSFNVASASTAVVEFEGFYDIDATDAMGIACRSTTGDPFSSGTSLERFYGSSDGYSEYFSYDLAACKSTTTTIGFQLSSGAASTSFGVALYDFDVLTLALGTSSYRQLSGTSMATPHVAGLAAMLFAYNPSFAAADVVGAIKAGGVSTAALAGKTTTGKAANAYGSLSYIAAPTGITASGE